MRFPTCGPVAVACALAVLAVEANAAAGALQEDRLRDAMAECRVQTTATARLDCYDAIALPETASVAESAVSETASGEEVFGFEFNVKEALQSLTSDVSEVRSNAKGGLVLTLANGQVWQQSDAQTLFLKEGDSVTITRGALSAFYLTKDGKGRRYRFARAR